MMNKLPILFVILLVQGCSAGYARLFYDFEEMSETPIVLYEAGSKGLAESISKSISNHIHLVQEEQYGEFKSIESIKVYVFSDKNHYSNYSGASSLTRGSATKNEVYISPIINDRIETLPSILVHELSHVHIRQHIGTWRYWTEVPGWFLEGLAVEISKGGGAEKVSDIEAIKSMQSGVRFTPREQSSILGHHYAHDYGLKPHLYYRQSGLFVRYLKERNPEAFKQSYLSLIQGNEFTDIWVKYYDKTVTELWSDFLRHIKA